MGGYNEVKFSKALMGRLSYGEDMLEELTDICRRERIALAQIKAIGAVKRAKLGYYNQAERVYNLFDINKPLEITNLSGNISLKDGVPMIHAHLTLADREGRAFGGHLAPGTIVFACEFIISILDGQSFDREFDEETGLPLWGEEYWNAYI